MDLEQVAEKTFALLEAEWTISKGRELIEALNPTHVIVHRRTPHGLQEYYLYTCEEALARLNQTADAPSVHVALMFNLDEYDATPLVDAYTNADAAPDRCIVHKGGQLIGFFDVTTSPVNRSRRSGPRVLESIKVASRSVIADFPDQVELDVVTSLLVSLGASESGSSGISVAALPLGTTLDIVVQTRRGFILEGRGEGKLMITDTQETLPLQFKLRSTALGPGQIRVLALHDGVALGAMMITPTVVEQSANTQTASPRSHAQALAPVRVKYPDLSLLIEEVWVNGRRAFTFRITSSNPNHNLYLAKFGPISFQTDPGFHDFVGE